MNLRIYHLKSKQLKKMAMENGLFTQVAMIRQRESYDKKEKDKTRKYNSQGRSEIIKRWFDIDHEWLKENFMTREPDFY